MARQGVTLLSTLETQDLGSEGELSRFALTHLADNAISLSYDRDHSGTTRSVAVIKTSASSHDTTMQRFTINDRGISISSAPTA